MDVPEKIYLKPRLSEEGESIARRCFINRDAEHCIEYVRADAFIEKACQFIKEHHHEFSFWNTEEYELGFSTQKFIEDFKKYMKGE